MDYVYKKSHVKINYMKNVMLETEFVPGSELLASEVMGKGRSV